MKKDRIAFEIKNDLSQLDVLNKKVEAFGEVNGWEQKTIFQINLVLDELITNVISYGYLDNEEHRIKVTMDLLENVLTIRLEDDGIHFDPHQAKEPDTDCPVEERKIGGLGIHFAKYCLDELKYERRGNWNVLTMKKTLHIH
jgi:anti-sigma regulatory factor (Ser/Thr protein kinase)